MHRVPRTCIVCRAQGVYDPPMPHSRCCEDHADYQACEGCDRYYPPDELDEDTDGHRLCEGCLSQAA